MPTGSCDGSGSAVTDMVVAPEEGSAHVVSPAIADDDRVFQEYLSNEPSNRNRRMIRSHPTMGDSMPEARPILFNIVPKRGQREAESRLLAQSHLKGLEELVAPYQQDLVDLFFSKVNICFPVFDEFMFQRVFTASKDSMSPSLLCYVYGNAMTYWKSSERLMTVPAPEQRSAWLHAEDALNAEWKSTPGISMILSIILNLCGRPSSHYLGNGVLLGMAVALANSAGLNRDPSPWNLSPYEKRFRIRIWWLLVIYDVWSSWAYGTPHRIRRSHYDVPTPTTEDIVGPSASNEHTAGASCFVSLIALTQVLVHGLEHVYHLSGGGPNTEEVCSDLDSLLVIWEDSLPDDLRRPIIRGIRLSGHGTANLRLAYLSVKLLICRVQLDWDNSVCRDDISSRHYVQARRVCEDIVDFVQELDEASIGGFWLPPTAHSLTSATTFLMRTALRSRGSMRNPSLKFARTMVDTLASYRRLYDFDIADNCLSNCGDLIDKVELACNTMDPALADWELSLLEGIDFTALHETVHY
ncbi:uncharacterized protein LTR77_008319 [Saxophila tyrrhenica]|uniref:Xylanolytic transcriptional activator regulatory domain-containing protein n=1 Tax=Saxophila tyrrhenica TaxID=1690608 RepID=A0AAV9P173_9PEZI|nr:hypothetical protein LTR77_008319 [Saxophila tyrrhenica]